MSLTEERRVSKDTSPIHFAEQTFAMMARFPAHPLDRYLQAQQAEELKAAYLPEALAMVGPMQTADGSVAMPYTMLWGVATA